MFVSSHSWQKFTLFKLFWCCWQYSVMSNVWVFYQCNVCILQAFWVSTRNPECHSIVMYNHTWTNTHTHTHTHAHKCRVLLQWLVSYYHLVTWVKICCKGMNAWLNNVLTSCSCHVSYTSLHAIPQVSARVYNKRREGEYLISILWPNALREVMT